MRDGISKPFELLLRVFCIFVVSKARFAQELHGHGGGLPRTIMRPRRWVARWPRSSSTGASTSDCRLCPWTAGEPQEGGCGLHNWDEGPQAGAGPGTCWPCFTRCSRSARRRWIGSGQGRHDLSGGRQGDAAEQRAASARRYRGWQAGRPSSRLYFSVSFWELKTRCLLGQQNNSLKNSVIGKVTGTEAIAFSSSFIFPAYRVARLSSTTQLVYLLSSCVYKRDNEPDVPNFIFSAFQSSAQVWKRAAPSNYVYNGP